MSGGFAGNVVTAMVEEGNPIERAGACFIRWPIARQCVTWLAGFHRSHPQGIERGEAVTTQPAAPLLDLIRLRFGNENERDGSPRLDARRGVLARVRLIYFFFLWVWWTYLSSLAGHI